MQEVVSSILISSTRDAQAGPGPMDSASSRPCLAADFDHQLFLARAGRAPRPRHRRRATGLADDRLGRCVHDCVAVPAGVGRARELRPRRDAGLPRRQLRAFSAATGALLWTSAAASQSYGYSNGISIADGVVITDLQGVVAAFDENTGAKLWEAPSSATAWISDYPSLPVVNGVVFYADGSGFPTAAKVGNGNILWSRTDLQAYHGSSAVGDGIVIFSSGSSTYGLSITDGSTRWTFGRSCQNSTYANSIFYITCNDRALRALDSSGTVRTLFGVHSGAISPRHRRRPRAPSAPPTTSCQSGRSRPTPIPGRCPRARS